MTFFPETPKDSKPLEWSRRLLAAIRTSRRITYKPRTVAISQWTKHMTALKAEHGDEVEGVLDWYCDHIEDEYTPTVQSALVFRRKFDQIRQAMDRTAPRDIVVTAKDEQKAQVITAIVTFPYEIVAVMPQIVASTSSRWARFLLTMTRWMRDHGAEERGQLFLREIVNKYGTSFVDEWVSVLHIRFGRLERYTGSVNSLFFLAGSSSFRDHFWHMWSYEWCHDPVAMDFLLKELLEDET